MEKTQIILEVIIILLGLYLAFVKSYFQEKGKNLATKEDIEEITKKVETIKNNLLFGTQSKLTLKNEERNALVNCYEKFSYWLNTSTDLYFGGINEKNQSRLEDLDDKLQLANFDFELAHAKMELFVNNKDLIKLIDEIKLLTLQLQHLGQVCIGDLEYIFFEIQKMRSETPPAQQMELYKNLLYKKHDCIKKFYDAKIDKYSKIAPMNAEIQNRIYKHLQALLKD